VYDYRANLDTYGDKAKFMEDQDREKYIETLNQVESWLYGDGQNATKEEYVNKLSELKVVGDTVDKRYRFHDSFQFKSQQFEEFIN
jgi:heat shock protein 4